MAFHETELQVAQILLQLPRLILDSESLSMLPLRWGSKKLRTMCRFVPLSGRKTPLSFPNSKLRITPKKRKRPENQHQNSSRIGGTKRRSCFSAAKHESSKRKKVRRSSNSSGALLLPDLNLPPLIEEEEGNCHEHEAHKPTLPLSA